MKPIEFVLIGAFLIFSLSQTGCASFNRKLKSMLSGSSSSTADDVTKPASQLTKFSESEDVQPRVKRQYKRTTKESLAEESSLDAKSGSLWVMEGQGAYLFSQNIVRLVGDPLAINLEGDPKDQLQSKVSVIKKLLAKIEERQKAKLRAPTGENADAAKKEGKDGEKSEKAEKTSSNQPPQEEKPSELPVKYVPTRIVERTLEGNYRIKGAQPLMIGSREYKIIVTGIVRAEDFNEEGISSTKLLDSKFDIVSARHKELE